MDDRGHARPASLPQVVDIIVNRYPDAVTAWLFGSQVDGRARADSDFDIVLLFHGLEKPFHEFVECKGIVLDLHCHTLESLEFGMSQQRAARMCFYARALSRGQLLFGGGASWEAIRCRAAAVLGEPVPVISWDSLRFNVWSKLGDLRPGEAFTSRLFIASELQRHLLCIFALQQRGWVARVDVMREWLGEDDPVMGQRFDEALEAAMEGRDQELRQLALSMLDLIGGPVRSGERAYVSMR